MNRSQESGVRGQDSEGRSQGSGIGRSDLSCDYLLRTAYYLLPTAYCLLVLLSSFLAAGVCRAQDSPAQRRQRIENMKPAEKKQLNRDYRWFMALEPAERRQLWQLHSQLKASPELRRTLHAYCEWLKSLPAHDRTELLALDTAERIERIRQLRANEAKRPKPKGMEGLRRWMQDYAAKPENQDRIFQAMFKQAGPRETKMSDEMKNRIGEMKKDFFEKMKKEPDARSFFAEMAMRGRMYRHGKPDWLTDDDLEDLRKNLSDETRKLLASKPADDQWEIICGWFRPSRGRPFSGRRFRSDPPPKELQEFFENELTPEQRAELLHLPADDMQQRLESMYMRRFLPMPVPMFGGRRPGPLGPPRDHPGRPGKGPRGEGPKRRGEGPGQNGRPQGR